MRQLVRVDAFHGPQEQGAGRLIRENAAFPVGDRGGEFGRPRRPLRRGDDVELLIRIRLFQRLFKELHDGWRDREDCVQLLALACAGIARQRHRPVAQRIHRDRPGGNFLEITDGDRQEIGRQRPGAQEGHPVKARLVRDARRDRRVADGEHVLRHDQREIERRLEARLVKAWQEAAGLDAFGLGQRIGFALFLHPEQPGEVRVEGGGIVDGQRDAARMNSVWKTYPDHAGRIHFCPAGRPGLAACRHRDRGHVEICPVHPDPRRGCL